MFVCNMTGTARQNGLENSGHASVTAIRKKIDAFNITRRNVCATRGTVCWNDVQHARRSYLYLVFLLFRFAGLLTPSATARLLAIRERL